MTGRSAVLQVKVLLELLVGLVGLGGFPAGVQLLLFVGLQIKAVVFLEVGYGALVGDFGWVFGEEVD